MGWTGTVGGHSYRFTDLRDLPKKKKKGARKR